jgi:hypothetical protein
MRFLTKFPEDAEGAGVRPAIDLPSGTSPARRYRAFRGLILPVMCAIVMAGAVELAIGIGYHPTFWQKSTWLMHDPYRGEIFDRTELYERLSHVEDSEPDIISVGDSSGFFSLQSKIVNRYTYGQKYISLNTGANQAYSGYQAIVEYMLRRSSHLKYVVLYVVPQLLPQETVIAVADLGPIVEDSLTSLKSRITPPSTFLAPYAKFALFENRRFHVGDPLSNHMPSLQLWSIVDDSLGWLPEFDIRYDRVDARRSFYSDARSGWYNQLGLTEPSAIIANLNGFYQMVHSYGAQLVIAFAPMPARALFPNDPNIPIAEEAFARLQRLHPDIKFLFPLITRWGTEKFGGYNHVSREYTFLSSERLGKALGRLLREPASIPPFVLQFKDAGPYPAITTIPLGPPDATLLAPALAFYLYTSTADPSYQQLIAKPVQDRLSEDPAYRYMMADASARNASLTERNIKIGFDLSELRATPVQVTGLQSCDSRSGVEWVQIDGNMIFTYASPQANAREPVRWPHSSHILIPTIVEDGVRKFDGYCPEPSLRDAPDLAQ